MKKRLLAIIGAAVMACSMAFGFSSCGGDGRTNADIGMAGMTVNESRLQVVDFAEPYYTSAQVITVRAGDTTFDACTTADDVETILKAKSASYKIGTQKGTTGFMYSYGDVDFEYDGFPVTTQAFATGALAMQALEGAQIDAVILDEQPTKMITESLGAGKFKTIEIPLTSEDYAFAINKNNKALKLAVNYILAEMKEDGSLNTLIASYFDGTATFTYENKTAKPQANDFVVATNAYFPPFESYDGDKLVGIDIEIASIIAKKLDQNLFVWDMAFDSIISTVAA